MLWLKRTKIKAKGRRRVRFIMPVGLITGGWFASAVISRVVTVASTYLEDHIKQEMSIGKEVKRLETVLPKLQSIVDAAENGQQQITDPQLKKWLWQFKDALYEADDVLDKLEYLKLKQEVEANTRKQKQKVRDLISHSRRNAIKFSKHVFKYDATLEKLRMAVKKLDEAALDAEKFVWLITNARQQHQQQQAQIALNRETGPLLTESKVFGRDKEKEEIVQWLSMMPANQDDSVYDNVSLLSIVGPGGMGKTTLAQLVYNDELVQNSFDLKIWVCVSTTFDVRGLTTSILEYATLEKPRLEGLPVLQYALTEKLKSSKKFLLVLDDVWNDDNSFNWDKLLAPLRYGHVGSKILLTTRMNQVAEMAARAIGGLQNKSIKLGRLHGDDFYSLFNQYAFAGVNFDDYKNLQSIGVRISSRLGGSPLVAKTIGALLNSNLDDRHWASILHSKNISDQIELSGDNIMSILMLSYHHLPQYLKPCFAYCSIFPQDYKFRKMDLVRTWMAIGLIQHSPQRLEKTMEDIGEFYFDELFRRSFFDYDGSVYFMHDLLRLMAQSISFDECFSFVGHEKFEKVNFPSTVRHLYVQANRLDLSGKVDEWKNLRSLVLIINGFVHPEHLKKLFVTLKSIRMLKLSLNMETLPDVFGHLRHMRSLEIVKSIRQFPKSLCKLYHLQVVKVSCTGPIAINNLVRLRHLLTLEDNFHRIVGVKKLIFLHKLHYFVRKESSYKIGELEDLNLLRKLDIKGLENVESHEEASMAKLCNKERLQRLSLTWNFHNNPNIIDDHSKAEIIVLHQRIFDCLRPHNNLKELTVTGYGGIRSASWMEAGLINNLQRISLFDCPRLEHLVPFWMLPFLKYLYLKKMPMVKKLDCDCQQLEVLSINDMERLEDVSGAEAGQWCPHLCDLKIENCPKLKLLSSSCSEAGQWCPHLRDLKIENCPELEVLPSLPLSLERMELETVGVTALPTLWLGSNKNISWCSTSSSSPSSLSSLKIHSCENLTYLSKGLLLLQRYLTALEYLEIINCYELVDFPPGGLRNLNALRSLEIFDCPKLHLPLDTTTPDGNDQYCLPSSLQKLSIEWCAELGRSIPELVTGTLACLTTLSLGGCNNLSLPSGVVWERISSLDRLTITKCEEVISLEGLKCLRYLRQFSISGCPKIVHGTESATTDPTLAIDELMIDDPVLLSTELLRNLCSVQKLVIFDCSQLESIADQMQQWLVQATTLNTLRLYQAYSLQSLPQLPSSLEFLEIVGSCGILRERCQLPKGADWPNIKHIQSVKIQ